MSLPYEQARAIAQARHFLAELGTPGKIKRIPAEIRREARARLKHMPMSCDIPRIAEDLGALQNMEKLEEHYRKVFWEEVKR
jgi:hypothetical protein